MAPNTAQRCCNGHLGEETVAYDRTNGEDVLELDQILGDVLVGLQKYFERFVGFSIV